MRWGIAYTKDGGPPGPWGVDTVTRWHQKNGQDAVWDDKDLALEANDLGGWTGYVCEYPSGTFHIPDYVPGKKGVTTP